MIAPAIVPLQIRNAKNEPKIEANKSPTNVTKANSDLSEFDMDQIFGGNTQEMVKPEGSLGSG